jgi:hypothetical protein
MQIAMGWFRLGVDWTLRTTAWHTNLLELLSVLKMEDILCSYPLCAPILKNYIKKFIKNMSE